jgi:DNA-binding NarL/FixJ family response regulator
MPSAIPPANPITVVIADDHSLIRMGFKELLENCPFTRLVGVAANGKELLDLVDKCLPQVVITDVQMPVMNGIEATIFIRQHHPGTQVVAISMYDDERLIADMLEAGARGYLMKDAPEAEIVDAIVKVFNKEYAYCSTVANKMLKITKDLSFHPFHPERLLQLNEKEREIARLVCEELCSKEIAERMNMPTRAVERCKERLLEKTGARNMVGIAKMAIKQRIYPLD